MDVKNSVIGSPYYAVFLYDDGTSDYLPVLLSWM